MLSVVLPLPTVAASNVPLFSDDFSSGNLANWSLVESARWSVSNGQMRAYVPQCVTIARAVAGENWWRDYALDYDITDIGVDDFVDVRIDSTGLYRIELLRRPNWIPARLRLWSPQGMRDYTFDRLYSGVTNHVRVEVLGQSIKVIVDGLTGLQHSDPTAQHASGKFGFGVNSGAWCSADLRFDNVVVTSLSDQNVPPPSILGRVADNTGAPISAVTISDGAGHTASTDNNGNYAISGLVAGTYTLQAAKDGYTFSPATRNVTVPPRRAGQDLTAQVVLPDLMMESISDPPAAVTVGASFSVSDWTRNYGLGAADASTTRYYFSLDQQWSSGDILLTGARSVPALAHATSSSGTTTVTVPATTPPGAYYLIACADNLKVVTESNETNNCRSSAGQLAVTGIADLSMRLLTVPYSIDPMAPGGNLGFTINVRNNGPSAATGVTLLDVLPSDVTLVSASSGCAKLGDQWGGEVICPLGSLASGSSATVLIEVQPRPASWLANTAVVTANETDPNGSNNGAIFLKYSRVFKDAAKADAQMTLTRWGVSTAMILKPELAPFGTLANCLWLGGMAPTLFGQPTPPMIYFAKGHPAVKPLVLTLDARRVLADLLIAGDPPDSNYAVIAFPEPPATSLVTPGSDVSQVEADAINSLAANQAQTIGLKRALLISMERAQGAAAAGNTEWVTRQSEAAKSYAAQLAVLLNEEPQLSDSLVLALLQSGARIVTATTDDVRNLQGLAAASRLPAELGQALSLAGATSPVLDQARELILAASPDSLPSLGAVNQWQAQAFAPSGDTTPPTIAASLSTTPNANGWNSSAVTVMLYATDNAGGDGVREIAYRTFGAQTALSLCSVSIVDLCSVFVVRHRFSIGRKKHQCQISLDRGAPSSVLLLSMGRPVRHFPG